MRMASGAEPDGQGQGAVDIEGPGAGTQIEHEIVGFGELGTEMAQGRGLAHASTGGEHAQAGIRDQLAKSAFKFLEARTLVEEGLALGTLGKRIACKTKALAIHRLLLLIWFWGRMIFRRGTHRSRALIVVSLDQSQRIESIGFGTRSRLTGEATLAAGGVANAIQEDRITDELILDEHPRTRVGIAGD
jgi:hypothetical protein